MKHAHIIGWGHYLPKREITNDQIAEHIETSHEWIVTRTGISSRHVVEEETTATMAFEAAARAISRADIHPSSIDLIIVATSTPEYSFPSTACQVQALLGADDAGAFDLSAACSGFTYALDMATQSVRTGAVKNALVIGAEMMSKVLDWDDRGTCILFGDGAGAIVLQGSNIPGGVLASALHSDGSGGNVLNLPAVYQNPMPWDEAPDRYSHYANGSGKVLAINGANGQAATTYQAETVAKRNVIEMEGRQVFRFATRVVPEIINEVLEKANMTIDDVNLIVPHQANTRIIDSAAKKLGVDKSMFYVNVGHTGNTSAASIPIALCEAIEEGRVKPNDHLVFVGFGGGLTWGATLINWGVKPTDQDVLNSRVRSFWYRFSRLRLRIRQVTRSWAARLSGSPTPNARLKDAGKKKSK